MSIEKLIEANTAAMIALTAALTAAGTVTAASTGTASTGDTAASTDKPAGGKGKGGKAPAAPKVTVEEMQAAVNEVKEKFGTTEAKEIIKSAGGVAKMADIPEAKIEAVFKAAKAKLEETGDDDQGGDDDI